MKDNHLTIPVRVTKEGATPLTFSVSINKGDSRMIRLWANIIDDRLGDAGAGSNCDMAKDKPTDSAKGSDHEP